MKRRAIQVRSLSKRYELGLRETRHRTLREAITQSLSAPVERFKRLSGAVREDETFLALDDVSFDIDHGEIVGIIGHNGAGKSTLLKILSQITEPTSGRVELHGRVGSLLEVGTGFHPELTGRENIILNAAILGMSRKELDRKFDAIVDFSGVERFLDLPAKKYSTGMRVRLGFAVAAHLEPEILIVDEVLSVGDAAFQKKCLGKMQGVAGSGSTVLFVSHNMQAISTLTQRGIVLSHGKVLFDGATDDAIQAYLGEMGTDGHVYVDEPSLSEPRITRAEIETSDPGNVHRNGEPMTLHFEIRTPHAIPEARFTCNILSTIGQTVSQLVVFDSDQPFCREPGVYRLSCKLPQVRLYMGHYTLQLQLGARQSPSKIAQVDQACPFEVVMYGQAREIPWRPGACVYTEDADWLVSTAAARGVRVEQAES